MPPDEILKEFEERKTLHRDIYEWRKDKEFLRSALAAVVRHAREGIPEQIIYEDGRELTEYEKGINNANISSKASLRLFADSIEKSVWA